MPQSQLMSLYMGDPRDLSGEYNTSLAAKDEAGFQRWASQLSRLRDLYDYDLRGAYKAGFRGNGHLPDTYKKPNHPTFSVESQYSGPGIAGGQWGENVYYPSQQNLRTYSPQELMQYFREVEPGIRLGAY